MTSKSKTIYAASGALSVIIILVLALTAAQHSPFARAPTEDLIPESVPMEPLDENPFKNGKDMSINDAEATLGHQILRPSSDLASDSNIVHVWVDESSDSASIYYKSGIRVFLSPQNDNGGDPHYGYEAVVEANDGASIIQTVAGVQALVTARDFSGNGQCGTPGVDCIPASDNPSNVSMILGGYSILVDADLPVEDVVAVADTIK